MGRRWYDDGKLAHAEQLQRLRGLRAPPRRQRVDAPGAAGRRGRERRRLLVGAVVNQAPELFAGVVAGVPFVDALTTMLDASLPLTVTEYDEWQP